VTNTNERVTGDTSAAFLSALASVTLRLAILVVDSGEGGGAYAVGESVNISADPAPEGQEFDFWELNEGPPDTSLPALSAGAITMPAGDLYITAKYKEISVKPPTPPTPSAGGGGGGGAPAPGAALVTADQGQISLDYARSGDTITINLPAAKVADIVKNGADGAVSFDASKAEGADAISFLPKTGLSDITDQGLKIKVVFPEGTMTLDGAAVHSLIEQARGPELTVEIKSAPEELSPERAAAFSEGARAWDLSVYSDGVQIHSYNGEIVITLPYAGQSPVSVWYMAEDGGLEKIESNYSAAEKTVTFKPPHLSTYVLSYDGWPFTDVAGGDWFYGDVAYVYYGGLMNGTGGGLFSPQEALSRAMLATVLGRRAGVSADYKAGGAFGDVGPGLYYSPYVAWAADAGVVLGTGGGNFTPDARVTRQDLVTMLYRYASLSGGAGGGTGTAPVFADANDISAYAVDAVAWASASGIVNGRPGGVFEPLANATRAEAAAILRRYGSLFDETE
jgi:hypothetical protein